MLNDQELEALFERRQLSSVGREVVRRIRNSDPSRRVRPGRGSMTCRYPSRKMRRVIQAESHTNELAAIYTWEFDETVHEFYDQTEPLQLKYHNGVRTVGYGHTPDFFLISDAFIGWVECKTDSRLAKLAETAPERFVQRDGQWHSPPGEEFAAQFGLGYMISPSGSYDWNLLRNLDFLADYIREECPPPSQEEISTARQLFEHEACMPLHVLIGGNSGLSADSIYKLILAGEIYADLSARPLTDEFARVYRDRYAAWLAEVDPVAITVPAGTPFTISEGAVLHWQGSKYTVGPPSSSLVHLLTDQGRLLPIATIEIDRLIKAGEITGMSEGEDKAPRLREAIVRGASARDTAEALHRLDLIKAAKQGLPVSCSPRTLRTYQANFQKAEVTTGVGALGLIPDIKSRGNRTPRYPEEVHRIVADVEREERERRVRRTRVEMWGTVRDRCAEQGLPVPSGKTLAKWRKQRVGVHEDVVHFSGHRMAYDSTAWAWDREGGFPPHGAYPFDVAHIDHTLLDLSLIDKLLSRVIGRVWLTALIDGYSRKVLVYYLSYDPPSAVSCMMVIRECVRRYGRLPSKIITDGGKEFGGTYFEILAAFFEMQKKTRPPAEGHFGSVMERLFGTTNDGLIHVLQGNTQILQCVRKCSASHDPRRLAIWTLDAIEKTLGDWFENVYHTSPHGGMHSTPHDVFQAGLAEFGSRNHVRVAYDAAFILSCLPVPKTRPLRKVFPGRGVKHYGEYYWCEAFRAPKHEKTNVPVRYDPFNMAVLYAYVDGEWQQCRAHDASLYAYRSEREMRIASTAFRALVAQDGKRREIRAEQRAAFFRDLFDDERELRQQRDANLANDLESAMPVMPASVLLPPPSGIYQHCKDF